MKRFIFLLLLCILLITINSFAQNPDSSKFIDISYIKSKTSAYATFEKQVWKPINRQLIKSGKKSAWYLYKVKYPQGESTDYDYVVINVFSDWDHLAFSADSLPAILKKTSPGVTVSSLLKRTDAARNVAWRQLFRLIGQAVAKEASPSKFLIVNEVKSVPGQETEYVRLEQTYFKPFHSARASQGIMNNWGLYKRELPYGEKFNYDYVAFNGYASWDDITRQNPPTAWKTAHGELNFNLIHDRILSKRATVNIECWELIDYLVSEQ